MKPTLWPSFPTLAAIVLVLGPSGAQSAAASRGAAFDVAHRAPANALFAKAFTSQLNGETFSTSNVQVVVKECGTYHGKVTFSGSGTTTGPYPGAFTTKGYWKYFHIPFLPGKAWIFRQTFKIKSGGSTIYGTIVGEGPFSYCKSFTGSPLTYSAGAYGSGGATANIFDGYLSETLQ